MSKGLFCVFLLLSASMSQHGLAVRFRAKMIGDELPNSYPVVNVAADEPAAVSLSAAEEAKAQEQMLAGLEEKVLKLKETMSGVLAAQSLDLEKLANVAEFVTRSG